MMIWSSSGIASRYIDSQDHLVRIRSKIFDQDNLAKDTWLKPRTSRYAHTLTQNPNLRREQANGHSPGSKTTSAVLIPV